MINISKTFAEKMKKSMKSNGLNPEDFVICFSASDCSSKDSEKKSSVSLSCVIIPLYVFSKSSTEKISVDVDLNMLFKRYGCWIASNTAAFFHLINRKVSFDKNNSIVFIQVDMKSKNNFAHFVGGCVTEHMKNEKLSKKQLRLNLKLTTTRFKQLLDGKLNLNLTDLYSISREIKGENKISKFSVLIEKFVIPKAQVIEEFFDV